jgi:hypothetical protein
LMRVACQEQSLCDSESRVMDGERIGYGKN